MVGRSEATLAQGRARCVRSICGGKRATRASLRWSHTRVLGLCAGTCAKPQGCRTPQGRRSPAGLRCNIRGVIVRVASAGAVGAVLLLSGAAVRRATFCFASLRRRSGCRARSLVRVCGERRKTGTRTWVARVRAEYPNQLDYSGFALSVCVRAWVWVLPLLARVLVPCAARRRRA